MPVNVKSRLPLTALAVAAVLGGVFAYREVAAARYSARWKAAKPGERDVVCDLEYIRGRLVGSDRAEALEFLGEPDYRGSHRYLYRMSGAERPNCEVTLFVDFDERGRVESISADD